MSGVLIFSKPPIILGEILGPIKSCSSAFLLLTMKNNFFASCSNVSGIFFLSPFTLDLIVASVPFFPFGCVSSFVIPELRSPNKRHFLFSTLMKTLRLLCGSIHHHVKLFELQFYVQTDKRAPTSIHDCRMEWKQG